MIGLAPRLRYSAGPLNGALYDLESGRVLSIWPPYTRYISDLLADQPLNHEALEWLHQSGYVAEGGLLGEDAEMRIDVQKRNTMLWMEITPKCNYKCIHCYAESGPTSTGTMQDERWLSLIEQAGAERFARIQFTGGDPTVHPSLLTFVKAAHAAKIPIVEVYTHGANLTDEWIRQFKGLGTYVAMSFYSDDEAQYTAITQNPKGYQRAVRSIKKLLAAEVPLRIGIIVMEPNRSRVENTKAFLVDLGVDENSIHVDEVRPSGRGASGFISLASLQPTTVATEVVEPVNTEPWAFDPPLFFRQNEHGAAVWNSCWQGELAIASDGSVYPCVFSRDIAYGDASSTSLADITDGLARGVWSLNLSGSAICETCEYRFACFDCRALTSAVGNTHDKPPNCRYDPASGKTTTFPSWDSFVPKWADPAPEWGASMSVADAIDALVDGAVGTDKTAIRDGLWEFLYSHYRNGNLLNWPRYSQCGDSASL